MLPESNIYVCVCVCVFDLTPRLSHVDKIMAIDAHVDKIMPIDDLATQGTKASSAMSLNSCARNNPASIPQG